MDNYSLDGHEYQLIKHRPLSPVSIFEDDKQILRVGPKEILLPELEQHRYLAKEGFPVPKILKEGTDGTNFYYLEEKVPGLRISESFISDHQNIGVISAENFGKILGISKNLIEAQMSSSEASRPVMPTFEEGINLNDALQELPDLQKEIWSAFNKIVERTFSLPRVITHGDFNPFNIFPDKVIDFGSIFLGPLGYDIVSNIFHVFNFPKEGDYEIVRAFNPSTEQINEYTEYFDKLFSSHGLPKISEYINDLIMARMIWSVVLVQRFPKLQAWRYNQIRNTLVDYLDGKDIKLKLID